MCFFLVLLFFLAKYLSNIIFFSRGYLYFNRGKYTRKDTQNENVKKRNRLSRQRKTEMNTQQQRQPHICYQRCSWMADWRHNKTVQQFWQQSGSMTSIHHRMRTHTHTHLESVCIPLLHLKGHDSGVLWMSGQRVDVTAHTSLQPAAANTWHSTAEGRL